MIIYTVWLCTDIPLCMTDICTIKMWQYYTEFLQKTTNIQEYSLCQYVCIYLFSFLGAMPWFLFFFSFVLWILWQGYCSSVLVILVCWGDFFLFCFVCFCLQQSSSYRLYSTGSLQHLPHNMKRTSQIKPICLWDKIYYVLHLNCIKKIKNY